MLFKDCGWQCMDAVFCFCVVYIRKNLNLRFHNLYLFFISCHPPNSMKNLKANMIVAASENMGIGLNGKLPWRLKEELQYFKKKTTQTQDPAKRNVVIMGRKTWESIPVKFRPLTGRLNLILSSTLKSSDVPSDVIVKSSLESALKHLQEESLSETLECVWIIGGSSVYRYALKSNLCHRIYLTKINKHFECDTFLNPIDESKFQLVQDPTVPQEVQEENGICYQFLVFERLDSSDATS